MKLNIAKKLAFLPSFYSSTSDLNVGYAVDWHLMSGFLTAPLVLRLTTSGLLKVMKKGKNKGKKTSLRPVECAMNVCSKLRLVYLKREMNSVNAHFVKLSWNQIPCLLVKSQKENTCRIY
jgi:hypothetical protein